MDVCVPASQPRGSSTRTAVPGSSHCGRTPVSPTARRSRRLTCRRVGAVTASEDELRPHVSGLVQSVAVVGDRALAITLRSQRVDVPLALAHPDLAIAKSVADSPWPLGTRSSRIATEGHPAAARAATVITVDRDNLPAIRFLVAPGDPRDLLDQGVDLLLTRDPAALELRRHAPAVSVCAAGLAANPRAPCARPLARVTVAVGGRAAGARRRCGSRRGAGGARPVLVADVAGLRRHARLRRETTPRPTPRIVYDASDGAARDLAERFVGLVRASGPAATALLDALLPDRPRPDIPARRRVDRRGAGAGTAAGNRCWLRDRPSTAGRLIRATTCRP